MPPTQYYFLEIMSGLEKGKRIPLPDGSITFGRSSENIVSLGASEAGVSSHHAIIYKSPQRIMLQDLQSTNGTFVNERRVTEQALYPGDAIGFGHQGPRLKLGASDTPLQPQDSASQRADGSASRQVWSRTVEGIAPFPAPRPDTKSAPKKAGPLNDLPTNKETSVVRASSTVSRAASALPQVPIPTKNSAPQPAAVEEPAGAISRYRIIRELGSGAMGRVFLAHDPLLDRHIALKVIAIDPALETRTRQDYLVRFAQEAKASAKLNHPSIVQIHDAGEDKGAPWIAFQLIKGESLEALLSDRRKLSPRRAILFTLDIAAALQHAHSWNIIHRDIKPANILIEQTSGMAMLADFGIAQAPGSRPNPQGYVIGSPGYMSPEQIDGRDVDQRSDLFSLGIVLYQMLAGEHPFLRRTLAETFNATRKGDYTPLSTLMPDLPKPVHAAVHRCLFPDVRMRLGSASELITLLRAASATQPLIKTSAAPAPAGKSTLPLPSPLDTASGLLFQAQLRQWFNAAKSMLQNALVKLTGRQEFYKGENLEHASAMVRSIPGLAYVRRFLQGSGAMPAFLWAGLGAALLSLVLVMVLLVARCH